MKKRVLSVFISTVLFVSTFCIQVNATESMEPDQISVFEDGDSDETYTEDEFSEEIPVEEDLGISEENTEIIFGDTENISDDVIPFEEEDGIWLDGEVVDENTDSDIDIIPEIEENPFNDAQAAADAEFWCGHFYKVYDTPMTPSAASAYCESMGGYLATFTSNSERSFLIDLVKSKSDPSDWYWVQSNTGAPVKTQLAWSNGEYSYYTDGNDGNGGYYSSEYNEFRYYALRYCKKITSISQTPTTAPTFWHYKDYTSEDADAYGFICEWGDYLDISNADISLSKTETVFNGNIQSVNVTAVYGGVTLEENRDYTYEISRNINV
ncbi:MAG: C-type lectin domain-containing protein, partial [Blautia sp.]|nr:C-type lectin domain-containing protein [Blautia sp.]